VNVDATPQPTRVAATSKMIFDVTKITDERMTTWCRPISKRGD
jgi:hypothetical protein